MAQWTISRKLIIVFITIIALIVLKLPVMAEPQPAEDEHIKKLLEKSLSVVEIDKEIERIKAQKLVLEEDMTQTRMMLVSQEEQIADKREAAGKVLRAYYMGDRNILLQALLSFDSLPDLFAMLDYIDIIIAQDKLAITTYKEHYRNLKTSFSKLEDKKKELLSIESRLHIQRDRVLALEQQIDTELAGRSDGDRLRLMMQELTTYWETAGLGEVKLYFGALSKAMQQLPTWIQDNKEYLEIDGFNYTIRVPQDALNLFLREQDERFKTFSFVFEDGKVTAQGERDGMELSITGHYTVENEPENGIIFHVDELLFNGFALPDTTRQTLEDQFDLGFYPSLIISFLQATSVETKDGELIIKLSVKL
ncbi:MAG: coiled-coil domain-containing protein [Candidatus Pristimantibacillus sp.]